MLKIITILALIFAALAFNLNTQDNECPHALEVECIDAIDKGKNKNI